MTLERQWIQGEGWQTVEASGGGGGAEFPPEWTVGADGSLQITPSDEPGGASLWVDGVGDSGNALFLRLPADSTGSLIQANVGVATAFMADFDGSVTVGRQLKIGGGDPWFANADGLQVYSGDGQRLVFQIRGGGAVQVYDSTESLAFKVDTDGSVHIKTGTSVVADL